MKKKRVIKKKRRVAIDTETTGLRPLLGDKPFAVGMRFDDGSTKYWEWTVDPMTREPKYDASDVAEIRAICEDESIDKYFWNAKFDMNMLEQIGVTVAWPYHEGIWMAKACDNLAYNYQLKPTAKKWLGFPTDDEKELHAAVLKCRRIAKKLGWKIAEEAEADKWLPYTLCVLQPRLAAKHGIVEFKHANREYCLGDVKRTLDLCELFEYGMKDLKVREVYDFEMTLMREVTVGMERRGVRVDEDRLKFAISVCQGAIEESLAVMRKASGDKLFNPGSGPQVTDLLFRGKGPGGLKLPSYSKNKGGTPKIDAEALMPHRHEYPVVDALLRYRANSKALSTFFLKYAEMSRQQRAGKIMRVDWNQWGTLTGRFSCLLQLVSNPKTTNSKSAEYTVDARQSFVPRRGCVWYCPDYSQVEVIIFADVAQEPTMLEAIRSGRDVHAVTADMIWGGEDNPRAVDAMKRSIMAAEAEKKREGKKHENYDWASGELDGRAEDLLAEHRWSVAEAESSIGVKLHRKLAKSATFTKIFGGGWRALMGWINVSPNDAKMILRWYDQVYPDMVQRMKEIEKRGKADGFVVNAFGRRLRIDPWYAYRAVNYLVQSAAADLMKRGMLKCVRYLKEAGLNDSIHLLMTIHDELVFEFKREVDDVEIVRELVRRMSDHEGVFSVDTPVEVDKVTERWSLKESVAL